MVGQATTMMTFVIINTCIQQPVGFSVCMKARKGGNYNRKGFSKSFSVSDRFTDMMRNKNIRKVRI